MMNGTLALSLLPKLSENKCVLSITLSPCVCNLLLKLALEIENGEKHKCATRRDLLPLH